MQQKLRDGSIVPSIFNVGMANQASKYQNNNLSLKEGVVTDILYPEDDNNISKKNIEYHVAVIEYSQSNGSTLHVYRNCKIYNLFGAQNNSLNFTLQPSTDTVDSINGQASDQVFKDGSRVLVLCISGVARANTCVILGGVQHYNDKIYSEKDGQFYDFNFNGIQQLINNDGEYIINFNSATDQDGSQANKAAAGTQIKVDKEGRVSISDNENQKVMIDRVAKKIQITDGADTITVDKASKSIELSSSGAIKETASKGFDMKSGAAMNIESGAALNMKASGATKIDAGGTMEIKSGGQWKLQASGNVQIISQGEVSIMSASGPLIKSLGPITAIGAGAVPAAGVGISQCFGIGNLGAPVMSTIITGSSTTFIGA